MTQIFGSNYFAYDKSLQEGPQNRSYAWADENSNTFFVAFASSTSRNGKNPFYEYSSYEDLSASLRAYTNVPDEDKCFTEQIREGRPCSEYYDIDLALDIDNALDSSASGIASLEQQVFAEFLIARNHFAPNYAVTTYAFKDNNKHMKAFMVQFQRDRRDQGQKIENSQLLEHIDMGVYNRNRPMRIIGSHKREDPSRPLQRALWHDASMAAEDREFFITNVHPDCILVADMTAVDKPSSPARQTTLPTQETSRLHAPPSSQIPQHIVKALQNEYMQYKHAGQYEMQYDGHASTLLDADMTYNAQFVKHEFLSPLSEPLKRRNGKFDICVRAETSALTWCRWVVLYKGRLPGNKDPSLVLLTFCLLVIRSATGTGKTVFVEQLVNANRRFKFVAVTCRRTLADMLGVRLGFSNYQDIRKETIECDRVVVQAESLHRLELGFYGENVIFLILDEFSSLCEQMTSVTTMGDMHDLNGQILREFIKGVTRVVCLDADLTNDEVQLVKSLRDDVHVIHNTFKPQEGDQVMMYESESLLNLKFYLQQELPRE
ncbi:origin of replication binding protein-domain-containing protein [Gamsiella multidivaricata]|uniref:origin of replication binding protein-domain-containing protein n=1 Tax=Gamsiella multidivaricata TaxID=101098 RepID=UPI00221F054B|nr:origin of replication binding protein-domain-containing protein [Gamsiella multidivaricata]KAI7822705.1 origin of replication binding protein-domain-containing protein [Gamsiella multidivaricata]